MPLQTEANSIPLASNDDTSPSDATHDQQRYYQSFPGAQYVLPSDPKEGQRFDALLLQHHVLKRAFQDKLVFAPIVLSPGDSVLDSGTGSAIWLLDIQQELPMEVNLYGIDIESRLFPPHQSAERLQLSIASASDLPAEWTHKFALVNQRLLVAALQVEQWTVVLKELYRVLTPGGWVQLGEIGTQHSKAGPMTERHRQLVKALFAKRNLLWDCAARLPSMLEHAGFTDIHVEEQSIPIGKHSGQAGVDALTNFAGVYRGLKVPLVKAGITSSAEYDELVDLMETEWNEVPTSATAFCAFYARKPLV
ncbi:S-adenosyl-L-methionine-dependent methyltransferase [Leucogyrophana mollusca]|uniref:S-adenosyl-L-methionine-dependent methyltransferase n=1 Tax=Leucogyrophana mollusca TaxID=85980 RepID=A0ACB8BBH6_9AGAM|nr:S-adenosyl-L-methionine-dependent methyltransferase [Leucogyrophana mollusca]